MAKKQKFIQVNNLPPSISISPYLLMYLFLDHVGASGWVWGVVFTLLGACTIAQVVRAFKSDAVDLLGNDNR